MRADRRRYKGSRSSKVTVVMVRPERSNPAVLPHVYRILAHADQDK